MSQRLRRSLAVAAALAVALVILGVARPASAATGTPVVGAFAGTTAEEWGAAQALIGPLTIRRSFDPTIVADGNEAWRVVASGVSQFYSLKPPANDVAGMTAGRYDTNLARVCAALPSGSRITVYHEPEDDFSAAVMRDLYRHIVPVCKRSAAGAGHTIYFWYVAMAYQWDGYHAVTDKSIPTWREVAAAVDRVGVDVYSAQWNGYHSLATAPDFQRWLTKLAIPSGKPWGIVERGISRERKDAERAAVIRADWAYLLSIGGATTYLWWDRDEGAGARAKTWALLPGTESAQAFAEIAAASTAAASCYVTRA